MPMAASKHLNRKVRSQKLPEQSIATQNDAIAVSTSDMDMDEYDGQIQDSPPEDLSDGDSANDHGERNNRSENEIHNSFSQVSFSALKQAQDAFLLKRKRDSESVPQHEQKLQALRERLQQIQQTKSHIQARKGSVPSYSQRSSQAGRKDTGPSASDEASSVDSDSESDSAPSEIESSSKGRTSKHAPTSQSSRRQVTRKRIVIDVPKSSARDPRFDAISRSLATHSGNSEKAYEFLRDYQKAEIAELHSAIKTTKDIDEKETLRRKMVSMQNRLKAKESNERQQAVLRLHRKEEREKVKDGKTPFYLKKKDLKEAALVEKFKEMKSRDRRKLMDRRRKKESQKEKKRMPEARRFVVE